MNFFRVFFPSDGAESKAVMRVPTYEEALATELEPAWLAIALRSWSGYEFGDLRDLLITRAPDATAKVDILDFPGSDFLNRAGLSIQQVEGRLSRGDYTPPSIRESLCPHRDVRQPYFEVLETLVESRYTRGTTVQLFKDYLHRIEPRNLDSLREYLFNLTPALQKKDFHFLKCLETSFHSLFSDKTLSLMNEDQDMPVLNSIKFCMLYSLSVVWGRPRAVYYLGMSEAFKKNYKKEMMRCIAYCNNALFCLRPHYNLSDIAHSMVTNFDHLWGRFYGPYREQIKKCVESTSDVTVMSAHGVDLIYVTTTKQFTVHDASKNLSIAIDGPDALHNVALTVPEFLPIVLGATPYLVNLTGMNKGISCKRDIVSTSVVAVGSEVKEKCQLIVKGSEVRRTFTDALELMVEFVFSQLLQIPRLEPVRNHFPRVYTIRSDVSLDTTRNTFNSGAMSPYPNLVVMEKKPGETLHHLLPTMTRERMKRVLLSVFSICSFLYNEIDFTHYDLHTGNIIVDGEDVYIIDMGRAHFRVDGLWIGKRFDSINTERLFGIQPHVSFPASDIFRLLMLCYANGHEYLGVTLRVLFPSVEPEDAKITMAEHCYSLQYVSEHFGVTYYEALEIIEKFV